MSSGRPATNVAEVKSPVGKDRQDAHKKQPEYISDGFNLADIFANAILRRPLSGSRLAAVAFWVSAHSRYF
jgi:hypothetical protein